MAAILLCAVLVSVSGDMTVSPTHAGPRDPSELSLTFDGFCTGMSVTIIQRQVTGELTGCNPDAVSGSTLRRLLSSGITVTDEAGYEYVVYLGGRREGEFEIVAPDGDLLETGTWTEI